jgi:hypothetical protein
MFLPVCFYLLFFLEKMKLNELSNDFVAKQHLVEKTCNTCGIAGYIIADNDPHCSVGGKWEKMGNKYLTCPNWVDPKDCKD